MIKVGKALIEESPNKNTLLARLCGYIGWLQAVVEPVQSVVDHFADKYTAGMVVGDIESAMLSRWSHCLASFHVGKGLEEVSKHCAVCIHQAVSITHFHFELSYNNQITSSHIPSCRLLRGF